jgi:hypothetical protein
MGYRPKSVTLDLTGEGGRQTHMGRMGPYWAGCVTLFICKVTAVCDNSLPSMDA